ncbi:Cys-tRNA(Pro) deacylase [Oceanobacillus sp. FSL H7-0719]|uniref:Cys-tRNA(Pro) deacylase n=1 Tax=Oceanobacillus sp. FSL H7-0719 TaxID=2954507 RepID=UPI0032484978
MKKKKTNVHRMLDKEKVNYTTHEYAWSEEHLDAETAAQNAKLPLEKVYKTLVTVGDKTGPLVACINAQDELNLKALAKISGNKKVDMLPMKELEKTTGYIRGGCSPIGMKKSYPTYLDERAKALETIVVSAGKQGHQVELKPDELIKLTHASYREITQN